MSTTIYLDTCALNRLTDSHAQSRVSSEADAVLEILDLAAKDEVVWMVSDFLISELSKNPDPLRRAQTFPLLQLASGHTLTSPPVFARASELQSHGILGVDALHLAACEHSAIESLITVDDRLIARASRRPKPAVTHVIHPIDWLQRWKTWRPPL